MAECHLFLYILNLPVNWFHTIHLQKFIRPAEMPASEKFPGTQTVGLDAVLSKSDALDWSASEFCSVPVFPTACIQSVCPVHSQPG